MTPEQRARAEIDRLFTAAGWAVQDYKLANLLAARGAKLAPCFGILHLTAERMLTWPIVVPQIAEQHRFVAEVDHRLTIVRGVEAEVDANLKRAHALRQAVPARAFAGG